MTILIEAEAKEIAELLTLLTPKERQIMNIRYPDECKNRMYSPSETKEKAATETAEKGEWFPEDSLHGKIYDHGKSIPRPDSINAPKKIAFSMQVHSSRECQP